MLSAIPVIIPTLNGRVHGVFWPANATARAGGLIILFDTNSASVQARKVLALLRGLCQRDGISVLEMSTIRSEASTRVADSGRYALHLLAGIHNLRSRGISDIAVIFCNSEASSALSPRELPRQLFTQCAEAIVASSTDWHDLTEQLTALTDSIHSAVDCIHGLTAFILNATTAPRTALRLSETLYSWTIDTLSWHGADTDSSATRPLSQDPANQSLPERDWSNVWKQASHLRAETVRARNIARQNFSFLQHQWDAMLKELEDRDAIRAANARHQMARVGSTRGGIRAHGDSQDPAMVLRAARNSWQFLDRAARDHWLKAWTQVFPFGGLGATQPSLPQVSIAPLH
jgi:hypothetical protein